MSWIKTAVVSGPFYFIQEVFMKKMRRVAGILLSIMLVFSLVPASLWAEPDAVTATVDFSAQMYGAYLFAPQTGVEVSSDLAENYGFTDEVDGISVLDVLVKAHEIAFGSDFTKDSAADYLEIGKYGSPSKQFGVDSSDYYGGFFYNRAMANDGTKYDDTNYNGTTVCTQAVEDGDLVEFFFYEDPYYGDTYNWFVDGDGDYSRSFEARTDKPLTLTLKGFYAMSASIFKDADEMIASDTPDVQPDVQIYLVDKSNGALTEIEDAITDEDGEVTLSFDKAGTYTIAAYGTDDCMFTQLLSLTDIVVRDPVPVTAAVDFTAQMTGAFLFAPQTGVEVSSDLAESYGFVDYIDIEEAPSVLDVLVKAHEIAFGSDFTKDSAADYLEIGKYGSPSKQFGVDSSDYYGGFFYNRAMANDGTKYDDTNYNGTTVTTQPVKDGDLVEFFFYEDPYYGDSYNWFVDSEGDYSRSFSVDEGEYLYLTLKSFFAMSASCFKDADEMIASETPDVEPDAQIAIVDLDTGDITDIVGAVTDENGSVALLFETPGTYTICAYSTDDSMWTQLLSLTTVEVVDVPPADDAVVTMVMSDAGEIKVPAKEVTVKDINEDGKLNLHEAFYAMHEAYYEGGAAAGYASAMTQWGLSASKLWGDTSGNFGYFNNDVSSYGLADPVADGDYIVVFIYKDGKTWSDSYAMFTEKEVAGDNSVDLSLEWGSKDEYWNITMTPLAGAAITVYDEDYNEVDASVYTVTDNEDGTYSVAFTEAGSFIIQADCDDPLIVPALAKAEIGVEATDDNGGTALVIVIDDDDPAVELTEEEAAKIINAIVAANETETASDDIETPATVNADDLLEVIAEDLTVLYQFDVKAEEGAEFPLTMTFDVPDAQDDQEVFVFHYDGTAWKLVGSGIGKSVDATFDSLSPVAIVAKAAPPPTGDAGIAQWIMLSAVSMMAAAATVVFGRKRREE